MLSTDEMVLFEKLLNTLLDILLCLTKSSRIFSLVLFTRHSSNWIFLFDMTEKNDFPFFNPSWIIITVVKWAVIFPSRELLDGDGAGSVCTHSCAVIWYSIYRDNTLREAGEK